MRVLQLIDSLEPGGAERLAVNLANTLVSPIDQSNLAVTRSEGALKSSIHTEVSYCYLERKSTFDRSALRTFIDYLKYHQINIVHAHSSSYFFAVLAKMQYPGFKLIWHNHNGESRAIGWKRTLALRLASNLFDGVINVNEDLNAWTKQTLGFKTPIYLRNFSTIPVLSDQLPVVKGEQGKRLVCLANLRYQKDILFLLSSFKKVVGQVPAASLHLIGRDDNDAYSDSIKTFISENNLEENVIIYGSRNDTSNLLAQMDVGVISSQIEGLPIALLEYGMSKLAVVVTDIGACAEVVGDCGKVVKNGDLESMSAALLDYLENPDKRNQDAATYHNRVKQLYGEQQYMERLLPVYNSLIKS